MPIDIGGALGGIGSFIGNQVSSAINSSRAWKYAQRAMDYQDYLNRNYNQWSLENNPTFSRRGFTSAGYNPLLALGSQITSQNAGIGTSFMNSDSDVGDQAVNSAMTAMSNRANIKNINEQTEKTKEEKKGIELDNRLKQKQLNTDPKAVISDMFEGNDTPVTRFLHKVGSKLGISTGEINSAVQSQQPNVARKIILHDNKPYIQKGVPRKVIKQFEKMQGSEPHSAVSSKKKVVDIDYLNKRYHSDSKGYYDILKHKPEGKKYYGKNEKIKLPPIPY